jgi:hypothetical protein
MNKFTTIPLLLYLLINVWNPLEVVRNDAIIRAHRPRVYAVFEPLLGTTNKFLERNLPLLSSTKRRILQILPRFPIDNQRPA